MDQDPEYPPYRHLPLTTLCTAFSNRSANPARLLRLTLALHVPVYSPSRPEMTARQAPVHPAGDFDADHPPSVIVLPCASTSVHVPVTVPFVVSGTAVHVPPSVRPVLLLALHVFG